MQPSPSSQGTRILAIVDWTVDANAVVAALNRHARAHDSTVGLLVPAWLHGLDWVGDPTASVPCAERQLEALARLCTPAGVAIGAAGVGDPDPLTATVDALGAWPAEEILLFTRGRHFALPPLLGLASRLARATALPVARVPIPSRLPSNGASRRRSGHCTVARPQLT